MLDYGRPNLLSLKGNPELGGEAFIQALIAKDPSVLNLGSLVLLERERTQPGAGRLDLLLKDEDARRWYTVEVQLGSTDESHIIRTIEYWDKEQKRYPDREYVAVIVAEKITNRFFNVIGLFNQHIPLIAIQLTALEVGGQKTVTFTRVLDVPGHKQVKAKVRSVPDQVDIDWKKESSPTFLAIANELQSFLNEAMPGAVLKFNKSYTGALLNGQINNAVLLTPHRSYTGLSFKMEQTAEWDSLIEANGLEVNYDPVKYRYRFRAVEGTITQYKSLFERLAAEAYKETTMDSPGPIDTDPYSWQEESDTP